MMELDRRKFLKASMALSLYGYLGLNSSFAQGAKRQTSFSSETILKKFPESYQTNPCRIFLEQYKAPENNYDFSKDQKLYFDNIVWEGEGRQGNGYSNENIGYMNVERKHKGDEVIYKVAQFVAGISIKGEICCDKKNFLALKSFDIKYDSLVLKNEELARLGKLYYKGEVKKGKISLDYGNIKEEILCEDLPILTQWQLVDALHLYPEFGKGKSHYFYYDCYTPLAKRRLRADKKTNSLGVDNIVLNSWLSYGEALPPYHFLTLDDKMPIGLTAFTNCWIIKKIEG